MGDSRFCTGRPVQSLLFVSHFFLWPPSKVPWRTVFDRVSCQVTWPKKTSLWHLTVESRGSWCLTSVARYVNNAHCVLRLNMCKHFEALGKWVTELFSHYFFTILCTPNAVSALSTPNCAQLFSSLLHPQIRLCFVYTSCTWEFMPVCNSGVTGDVHIAAVECPLYCHTDRSWCHTHLQHLDVGITYPHPGCWSLSISICSTCAIASLYTRVCAVLLKSY